MTFPPFVVQALHERLCFTGESSLGSQTLVSALIHEEDGSTSCQSRKPNDDYCLEIKEETVESVHHSSPPQIHLDCHSSPSQLHLGSTLFTPEQPFSQYVTLASPNLNEPGPHVLHCCAAQACMGCSRCARSFLCSEEHHHAADQVTLNRNERLHSSTPSELLCDSKVKIDHLESFASIDQWSAQNGLECAEVPQDTDARSRSSSTVSQLSYHLQPLFQSPAVSLYCLASLSRQFAASARIHRPLLSCCLRG